LLLEEVGDGHDLLGGQLPEDRCILKSDGDVHDGAHGVRMRDPLCRFQGKHRDDSLDRRIGAFVELGEHRGGFTLTKAECCGGDFAAPAPIARLEQGDEGFAIGA
jgi:hypothetical protein